MKTIPRFLSIIAQSSNLKKFFSKYTERLKIFYLKFLTIVLECVYTETKLDLLPTQRFV